MGVFMTFKTYIRRPLGEIRDKSASYLFISGGFLKHSKNNVDLTSPYYKKPNICIRFILYALIFLKDDGEQHIYKSLVKEYITDDERRNEMLRRIKAKIRSDIPAPENQEVVNRLLENANHLWQSDYEKAYQRLGNIFFRTERHRTRDGHYAHFLILNKNGNELRELVMNEYVF